MHKNTNERKSEMEEKTIGAFLSALRKSKGLTQRELAEMLNVSDKAVSRWERDECAPDLTLIPVLAEIYDVTCDEILKGQRITKTKEEAPSVYVKSEKQLDRLLRKSRVNYLTWCIISVGAAVLGLIISMVANFSFDSALGGFFIGSVFISVAVVITAVLAVRSFFAIEDMELPIEKQTSYRYFLIFATEIAAAVIITIFAIMLPLTYTIDGIPFLVIKQWITLATLTGFIALIVSMVVVLLTYLIYVKDDSKKGRLKKLKVGCIGFTVVAVLINILLIFICTDDYLQLLLLRVDFSCIDTFIFIRDIFIVLTPAEIIAAIIIYVKKSKKIKNS